jgi:phosphatidylinositol alpha-1,6-mannosyltransferase
VKLVGTINENQKKFIFSKTDIMIMPTIDETHANSIEGFGIAYIEAAQYGIPSIASNVGGTPEAVLHNKTGLIINNFNELDESIKNLVENKQNRIELGQNAKNRAENELIWEKQVVKYNKLIDDIQ